MLAVAAFDPSLRGKEIMKLILYNDNNKDIVLISFVPLITNNSPGTIECQCICYRLMKY